MVKGQRETTPGSLIDKLLNNPHAALRREPRRYQLLAETGHQQQLSAVGQGRYSITVGDASLTAQHPLLNGGEGE